MLYVYRQLLDGLDVLQRNTLSPLKQDFIANKLIGTYRNMTAQDLIRSGKHVGFFKYYLIQNIML